MVSYGGTNIELIGPDVISGDCSSLCGKTTAKKAKKFERTHTAAYESDIPGIVTY
jgi:hypothetical protein